jgi:hypothetical protein
VHARGSGAAHSWQNFPPASFSDWHRGHFIAVTFRRISSGYSFAAFCRLAFAQRARAARRPSRVRSSGETCAQRARLACPGAFGPHGGRRLFLPRLGAPVAEFHGRRVSRPLEFCDAKRGA